MNGNENIVHVEAIEGLMSEVNKHLDLISPNYAKERIAKVQAIDDIRQIQAGSLYILRTLFEGD